MLARTDVVRRIGGMDERFFLYSEEPDLSLRASKLDWETWHLPTLTIVHYGGNEGSDPRLTAQLAYARRLYLRKHGSPAQRVPRVCRPRARERASRRRQPVGTKAGVRTRCAGDTPRSPATALRRTDGPWLAGRNGLAPDLSGVRLRAQRPFDGSRAPRPGDDPNVTPTVASGRIA